MRVRRSASAAVPIGFALSLASAVVFGQALQLPTPAPRVVVPERLLAGWNAYRAVPPVDAARAAAARSALLRRVQASRVPLDLRAVAREETARQFASTRSAEEVDSLATYVLVDAANAAAEDEDEVSNAAAALRRAAATATLLVSRCTARARLTEPPEPDATAVQAVIARMTKRYTRWMRIEYFVPPALDEGACEDGDPAAEAAGDAEENAAIAEAMQRTQAKVETASKMSKFAFELGKTIRSNWP